MKPSISVGVLTIIGDVICDVCHPQQWLGTSPSGINSCDLNLYFKDVFSFIFMCTSALFKRVPACHTHAWCPQKSEGCWIPPDLELQMVVGCHVSGGNPTWALWETRQNL